jgi:hypothetical protein
MCSINIDESAIHVSIAARPSCLCVLQSEKLERLLDLMDNQCTMHGFQHDVLEWAHMNQNGTHCCSTMMLHGL